MSRIITVRGKKYDLNDVGDLISIQNVLVPDNWPGKKADCVRVLVATADMLALELKRHLAANWKKISKACQEEMEDGEAARMGVSFAFEIDQSAPSVAALTKIKMSHSVRNSTESKPKTHDVNQGVFLGDDMSIVFDVKSLAEEQAPAEKPEEPEAPKSDAPASVEQFPAGGASNIAAAAEKVDKARKASDKAVAK